MRGGYPPLSQKEGEKTGKRRFSITYAEAEIIIFALTVMLDRIKQDSEFQDSAYWQWISRGAEAILQKLTTYEWEK